MKIGDLTELAARNLREANGVSLFPGLSASARHYGDGTILEFGRFHSSFVCRIF